MSRPPVFTATVTRDDGLWAAVIDGPFPPGTAAATDVEHLPELEGAVRDVIELLAEIDRPDYELALHFTAPRGEISLAMRKLRDSVHALERATIERRQAILALREAGLTVRDVADAAQLSSARVHQLEKEAREAGEAAGIC